MFRAVFTVPLLSLALAVPTAIATTSLIAPGEAMAQSCPRGEVFRDRKCQPLADLKKKAPKKGEHARPAAPPKDARHAANDKCGPPPKDQNAKGQPTKTQPPQGKPGDCRS